MLMLIMGLIMLAGGALYLYDGIRERRSNCIETIGKIVDYRQNYKQTSGKIKRSKTAAIIEYYVDGKAYKTEIDVTKIKEGQTQFLLRTVKGHPETAFLDSSTHTVRSVVYGVALTAVGLFLTIIELIILF